LQTRRRVGGGDLGGAPDDFTPRGRDADRGVNLSAVQG